MKKLLEDQKELGSRNTNAYTNMLKKGCEKITLGDIESRLERLEDEKIK